MDIKKYSTTVNDRHGMLISHNKITDEKCKDKPKNVSNHLLSKSEATGKLFLGKNLGEKTQIFPL